MDHKILALAIISSLLLIIDYYIFQSINSSKSSWTTKQHKIFTYLWWSYSFFLILGVFIGIYFNIRLSLRAIILVAFFITFISKLFFLPFLFIDDLRRSVIWLKRKFLNNKELTAAERINEGNQIPRSEFLLNAGAIVAAIPLASLTYGMTSSAYDYQVKRRMLYLPNLPKAFEGIKLGQISDIHSGSFYNKKAVMGGVDMLLKEKPDLIFFTGDLVNNLSSEIYGYQDIFSKIKAPLGVFSILGNHDYGDYYFGKDPSPAKSKNLAEVKNAHKNIGWDLLLNENRRVKVDGEELAIIGIENWGAGRFAKYGRMDIAVKNTDDAPVKLLLSHDPSHWRAQVLPEYPQIDVMFSGHTHGMQFGILSDKFHWSPIQYIYEEWAGFYHEKQQQLYVNVGYGFLGYPGRVGILPEITIFELHRGTQPV